MTASEISPELKAKYGDRLAALSPAQRALLERAMKKSEEEKAATAAAPVYKISRRSQPNFCPLSIDQERIWFVQQINLESPIYNIYTASRYNIPLELPVLARAVDHVVSRYEILRTTFPAIDGRPVQQIAPELKVGMPWIDLRRLPVDARRDEADRLANESVRRPFSLVELPLFRMLIIQLTEDEYIWPVTLHHIITDWISFYSFEAEIRSTYAAFLGGEPSPFPEPRLQYADYTVWQRERMATKDLGAQVSYWQELLRGVPETVPLPIDFPRPPVQSPVGGRQRVRISHGLWDRLRALAQRESTTPFVVMLAVLKTLLVRLSGQEQVIVGTPMSQRSEAETQDILGFFLSQLIYFSDYTGNPTFREAVRRERESSIAAYAHSEVPFSIIVESLGLERDLSRTPFFQIQLLLLTPGQVEKGQEDGTLEIATQASDAYWVDAQRTQSELAPIFWETAHGLSGFFEYNKGIFEAATIDRMKEQFRVLLAAAIEQPEASLWSLPLLPESQRHQLLVEWAESEPLPIDAAEVVHAAFEAQAAANPEAPAVITKQETVSYGELDRRADRLAHHLAGLGVGPETPVVVAVERSAAALVALLSVLKAGGVYVPVEPDTPADRARFMIRDSGAPVVIAGRQLPWEIGEEATAVRMADEAVWSEPAAGWRGPRNLPPTALAYVIYTSGSTGEPKGVAVPHGAAAAYFERTARDFGARPGERSLVFSIFAFDAAMEQVFSPLATGAALALRGEEVWDPAEVGATLERLEVDVAFLPPSYWGRWTQTLPPAGEAGGRPRLRLFHTGGEAMSGDWVNHWQASAYGRVPLYNLYGPTETVVAATSYPVPAGYEERGIGGRVPIGRSMPGRTTYVVDHLLNPLPSGVPGELLIGGPIIARGYFHRPELSAASFVPDPFGGKPGARLYRTGDRVRTLADGALEFLGRIDFQVKVRGFRIELGEIEAALLEHPKVAEAAVAARDAGGGHSRLVAYVVPEAGQTLDAAELREALRLRLPEYMVPASFVTASALPYLGSGKVDRRALDKLPETEEREAAAAAAPITPAEKILVAIWKEVLRRPEIGIHDNFFSLGGDSILSIQVIARAQRAGLKLSPRQLFQHQTIAELAQMAVTAEGSAAPQGPVTGPVPLLPIARWYFGTDPVEPYHFNLAVLFETAVRLAPLALARALALLEFHHDALRLRFHRDEDGQWRQENAAPEADATGAARWPLTVVDLSALPDGPLSAAIEDAARAAQGSFDLARGPLYRSLLFDAGPERPGRFFWAVNHLAVDGVSWRILLDDLASAYAAFERAGTAALPPKTTSFQQWAERLAAHAGSESLAAEAAYWRVLPWDKVARLPVDEQDGDNSKALERTVGFILEPEATRQLLEDVHKAFNTRINDVLLAAFARALADWTGAPVVLLDLESHGREEIFPDVDLSRTVGWLTSAYPVLFDLSRCPDPIATLKNVKEHLRTVPANGLGYGLLRYPPDGASRLGDLPAAQVSFNYLGQLDSALPEEAPFTMAGESAGPQQSPRGRRSYLLEWSGSVLGGSLRMACAYSAGVHRPATVERLADSFRDRLLELIERCLRPETRGFTPSDFAGARLNQKQLDKILGKLGQGPGRK